jgi:hypothetical protein
MIGSRESITKMISEIDFFKGFLDGYAKLSGETKKDTTPAAPASATTPAPAAEGAKPAEAPAADAAQEPAPSPEAKPMEEEPAKAE